MAGTERDATRYQHGAQSRQAGDSTCNSTNTYHAILAQGTGTNDFGIERCIPIALDPEPGLGAVAVRGAELVLAAAPDPDHLRPGPDAALRDEVADPARSAGGDRRLPSTSMTTASTEIGGEATAAVGTAAASRRICSGSNDRGPVGLGRIKGPHGGIYWVGGGKAV